MQNDLALRIYLIDRMDGSYSLNVSYAEKDAKHEKAVHKRRSSVFQSRTLTFPECKENENENLNTAAARGCASEIVEMRGFNLEEYTNSLKKERKEWIETLKERKSERRNLTKQKLLLETQGQPLDLNILADNEKAFICARPNYQEICNNYKRISDISVAVSVLHNMVYELNERFILQMEEKLKKATEKLIEASRS